jgi:ATP-binding cassette subfamily B protein
MLTSAPILILDEATSALDSVTENYIQESLERLMQNRTTLVIAHRLSTLSKMDRILVFDQGKIVEEGSHLGLLSKKGHYARMWQMQAGGFLPDISINKGG